MTAPRAPRTTAMNNTPTPLAMIPSLYPISGARFASHMSDIYSRSYIKYRSSAVRSGASTGRSFVPERASRPISIVAAFEPSSSRCPNRYDQRRLLAGSPSEARRRARRSLPSNDPQAIRPSEPLRRGFGCSGSARLESGRHRSRTDRSIPASEADRCPLPSTGATPERVPRSSVGAIR